MNFIRALHMCCVTASGATLGRRIQPHQWLHAELCAKYYNFEPFVTLRNSGLFTILSFLICGYAQMFADRMSQLVFGEMQVELKRANEQKLIEDHTTSPWREQEFSADMEVRHAHSRSMHSYTKVIALLRID
jgi:hypothetical protein